MILTHKLTPCSQRGTAVASPGNTARCAYLQSIVTQNITLVNLYHARLLRVTQLNIRPILSLIFNKASMLQQASAQRSLLLPIYNHRTKNNKLIEIIGVQLLHDHYLVWVHAAFVEPLELERVEESHYLLGPKLKTLSNKLMQ